MTCVKRFNIWFWAFLLLAETGSARVWEFSEGDTDFEKDYQADVNYFAGGDDVILRDETGEIILSYHLEQSLEEGSYGRVFVAKNSQGTERAVKFRKKQEKGLIEMNDEVESFKRMKEVGIPSPSIYPTAGNISLEKDILPGPELYNVLSKGTWESIPAPERFQYLTSLNVLMNQLVQSPYLFKDVHTGNVMWGGEQWEVLDPGPSVPDENHDPKIRLSELTKYIETGASPAMQEELKFSQKHEPWLKRLLVLNDSVLSMQTAQTLESLNSFRAISPLDLEHAPKEYRRVWGRARQLAKKIEKIPGIKQSFCFSKKVKAAIGEPW